MFPAAMRHSATFRILAASSEVRNSTRGQQRPLNELAGLPWFRETQNSAITGSCWCARRDSKRVMPAGRAIKNEPGMGDQISLQGVLPRSVELAHWKRVVETLLWDKCGRVGRPRGPLCGRSGKVGTGLKRLEGEGESGSAAQPGLERANREKNARRGQAVAGGNWVTGPGDMAFHHRAK